ncbi:MAG: hypothetical protein ACRCXZ_02235 [Patescibacteria group bacterium]
MTHEKQLARNFRMKKIQSILYWTTISALCTGVGIFFYQCDKYEKTNFDQGKQIVTVADYNLNKKAIRLVGEDGIPFSVYENLNAGESEKKGLLGKITLAKQPMCATLKIPTATGVKNFEHLKVVSLKSDLKFCRNTP